jgi:hypothetical protein
MWYRRAAYINGHSFTSLLDQTYLKQVQEPSGTYLKFNRPRRRRMSSSASNISKFNALHKLGGSHMIFGLPSFFELGIVQVDIESI